MTVLAHGSLPPKQIGPIVQRLSPAERGIMVPAVSGRTGDKVMRSLFRMMQTEATLTAARTQTAKKTPSPCLLRMLRKHLDSERLR